MFERRWLYVAFCVSVTSTVFESFYFSRTSASLVTGLLSTLLVGTSWFYKIELRKAEIRAVTDPLTGIPNRAFLVPFLDFEIHGRGGVGLLAVDFDRFKEVNDLLGHHVGDKCLQTFVRILEDVLRKEDVPIRMGGDEFVIVLLGVKEIKVAMEVAERIRQTVETSPVLAALCSAVEGLRLTTSIGVVVKENNEDRAAILERADAAMYEAKKGGRNRVTPA